MFEEDMLTAYRGTGWWTGKGETFFYLTNKGVSLDEFYKSQTEFEVDTPENRIYSNYLIELNDLLIPVKIRAENHEAYEEGTVPTVVTFNLEFN